MCVVPQDHLAHCALFSITGKVLISSYEHKILIDAHNLVITLGMPLCNWFYCKETPVCKVSRCSGGETVLKLFQTAVCLSKGLRVAAS